MYVPASALTAAAAPWFESPVLIAAIIGLVGSVLTTVLNNRATLKRERLARSAQRQGRQGWNAFAAILLLAAGALFWSWWTTHDTRQTTAADDPIVVSQLPLVATEHATLPTGASAPAEEAATCPSRAEFEARPNEQFGFTDLPSDGARLVLQLIVASQSTGTRFVVSVCRDSSSYWYFSRQLEKPEVGLIAPASVTESGFEAVYHFSQDVVYGITSSGGIVKDGDKTLVFDLRSVVCVVSGDMPPALLSLDAGTCTSAAVVAWSPE